MKFRDKTKKKIMGSISVLLVIILLPMMTFSALIVDMSRINMAKQMMSGAGDLTMNTALANYDTILKDVYGLFAMSQAEGMDNEELGTELNDYFARTLTSYGVVSKDDAPDYVSALIGDFRDILNNGNVDTTNFLKLDNIDVTATKVTGSSLANASVLRKQVVEYMKYRAPMGVGLSFLDSLTAFEKVDDQNEVVEAQVKAQESTQDVTKACQTLIKMIRAYDKRIVEIDSALTGVTNSTDGVIIPLEDYDTHPLKYQSQWGENYAHINKLNLVFMANSPSVDGVYLKSLNYIGGKYFVSADGSIYNGTDTGIDIQPELAGDTASAKSQVDGQIANLNNNYKAYADKYANSMLPASLLTYSGNINTATITAGNETAAIDNFVAFEKFLLDQSENGSITYSQLKTVLEQIYTLGKYLENYKKWINEDISTADAERQAAQNVVNELYRTRNNAATTMDQRIEWINNSINSYLNQFGDDEDPFEVLKGVDSSRKSQIQSAMTVLPERTVGYESFYDTYIGQGASDRYIEQFKWLVNSSNFGTGGTKEQKSIIEHSKAFVKANGYDANGANGYDSYMKGKLDAAEESEDLFKLLTSLMTCHAYAIPYNEKITEYNQTQQAIPGAERILAEKKAIVDGLKQTRDGVIAQVKGCLVGYHTFCSNYQSDAYYYKYYIIAAENTAEIESLAIQKHFSQLIAYLEELRSALNEISKQIVTVKEAIKTYNQNLNKWENANTSYASENGDDSFSDQTSADIEKARTEYDEKLYDTLDTFVIAMWNEFDTLYSKLTDATNFLYGTKRIDKIQSAQDLKDAVSGVELSDVVTVEEAEGKLAALYKGESVDYVPYTIDAPHVDENGQAINGQLQFLSPMVLQIQALKYLNSAYPDDSKLSDEEKLGNEQMESEYNEAKNKLTGNDTEVDPSRDESDAGEERNGELGESGETSDEVNSDFGYTFKSNGLLSAGSLPSAKSSTDDKTFTDEEYILAESGEGEDARLDASSGVAGQTEKSNSVLKGIGNVATAAVENLYILNYVFENFSYNTIVQEQIIKDLNKEGTLKNATVVGQIAELKNHFNNAETISSAKAKTTTLSNFEINEHHNHLYGGEIEYILFGNSNPATNVTSAKASIYAIRFVFNCIFAFTDTEIRNSTMAAGLAVQAATLGIVPYQVVQIVLQLALAAAESAIDLSAMNHGLTVAIVKTKDTWSLSMTGASNALKDGANAAAQMVANKLSGAVVSAVDSITTGLNDLVDAGAEELKGAINNLELNMTTAAEGVLESVVDNVLSKVMVEIEQGLNELQYVKVGNTTLGNLEDQLPTKEEVLAKASSIFQGARDNLSSIISSACGGNEMALSLASRLQEEALNLIENMETEVISTINTAGDVDITEYITHKINVLKRKLIGYGNEFIGTFTLDIAETAKSAVDKSAEELTSYINECGDEISQEAAEVIREKVSNFANNFVDNTLKINGNGSGTADIKSSAASMFQFGYKDYLMLLTYISICCGDSVLLRTADVIQMNLQSADGEARFKHKANNSDNNTSFQMSKAYTYVSISATADLDMFFMDMSIFADQVSNDVEVVSIEGADTESEKETNGTQITYKGILGY